MTTFLSDTGNRVRVRVRTTFLSDAGSRVRVQARRVLLAHKTVLELGLGRYFDYAPTHRVPSVLTTVLPSVPATCTHVFD